MVIVLNICRFELYLNVTSIIRKKNRRSRFPIVIDGEKNRLNSTFHLLHSPRTVAVSDTVRTGRVGIYFHLFKRLKVNNCDGHVYEFRHSFSNSKSVRISPGIVFSLAVAHGYEFNLPRFPFRFTAVPTDPVTSTTSVHRVR